MRPSCAVCLPCNPRTGNKPELRCRVLRSESETWQRAGPLSGPICELKKMSDTFEWPQPGTRCMGSGKAPCTLQQVAKASLESTKKHTVHACSSSCTLCARPSGARLPSLSSHVGKKNMKRCSCTLPKRARGIPRKLSGQRTPPRKLSAHVGCISACGAPA